MTLLPPGYVRPPWSKERRERASEAAAQRLGSRPGHRRLYGVELPRSVAEAVRPEVSFLRQKLGKKKAQQFLRRLRKAITAPSAAPR